MAGWNPKICTGMILLAFLIAACGSGEAPPEVNDAPGGEPQLVATQGSADGTTVERAEVTATITACLQQDPQEIAMGIAGQFEVEYDQIMTWFCSGHSYEDILLALESSQGTEYSVDALLAMIDQGKTWDQIWEQIGLVE